MTLEPNIRRVAVAAAFSTALLASAMPAQAQSVGRGFLAGLVGGMALGAFAAAAQAQHQPRPILATVPAVAYAPEFVAPETQVRRRVAPRAGRLQRAQRVPQRPASGGEASSRAFAKCGNILEARARPLGAVDVSVSSAGGEVRARDGWVVLPIDARIEYARNGMRQVRQARVTCRMNTDGQVELR